MTRIGIDGGCLANRRGFGRFARRVIAALAEANTELEFAVIVDRPSLEEVSPAIPESFEIVTAEVSQAPAKAAKARGARSGRDLLRMGSAAARAGLDLIYFPATYTFFPVWNVPRVVVTMHDTLALEHPEWVFPDLRGRLFWTLKERAAALWADRVVTVSETAKRDLVRWFRFDEAKVAVASEAADPVFRPLAADERSPEALARYKIPHDRPYMLYVGGLSPHKNLVRLIEAFGAAQDQSTTLVLVGDFGDAFYTHVPELVRQARDSGAAERLIMTGYVPDEDLVQLYNQATFLIQPSLMEGFGLPPVEALACGLPTAHSRSGSLPEVIGDAGLSFDATDVGDITRAIDRMFADGALRSDLCARAIERSRKFSWSAAAAALVQVFRELAPAAGGGTRRSA